MQDIGYCYIDHASFDLAVSGINFNAQKKHI